MADVSSPVASPTTSPSTSGVTRAADRERVSFSPTSSFSFVTEGGPGQPEFFEERSARGDGPPLHRHPWPTWELVLSGSLLVEIEGERFTAEAGDTIYVAPNAVHAYVVASDEAHVVGVGMSDGRFPKLQVTAAPLFMAEGGPDMAAIGQAAADAGLELMGPPISLE